jgi:hypothetical protein
MTGERRKAADWRNAARWTGSQRVAGRLTRRTGCVSCRLTREKMGSFCRIGLPAATAGADRGRRYPQERAMPVRPLTLAERCGPTRRASEGKG